MQRVVVTAISYDLPAQVELVRLVPVDTQWKTLVADFQRQLPELKSFCIQDGPCLVAQVRGRPQDVSLSSRIRDAWPPGAVPDEIVLVGKTD